MTRLAVLLVFAAPAFGQWANVLPQPRTADYHPIYDHPKMVRHLAHAAATGRPVVVNGDEDGVPYTYTARPDGMVDRARRAPQPPPAQQSYPVTYYQPRAEVAAPQGTTFRNGYNPSHTCPQCGTQQWMVEREMGGGRHSHRCNRCGVSWWH
jgi:hypothetical protein